MSYLARWMLSAPVLLVFLPASGAARATQEVVERRPRACLMRKNRVRTSKNPTRSDPLAAKAALPDRSRVPTSIFFHSCL